MLVCTRPDAALGDYAQPDHALPNGKFVAPTLSFRTTVADIFAGAPDTTLSRFFGRAAPIHPPLLLEDHDG